MIKKFSAIIFLMLITFPSYANIVGSAIDIHRAYPSVDVDYDVAPVTTVVAQGVSDKVVSQYANIDIEQNKITIEFFAGSAFEGVSGSTFDGYVFRGFNGKLSDANLISSDLARSQVMFDADSIYVDLGGSFAANFKVVIGFTAEVVQPQGALTIRFTPEDSILNPSVSAQGGQLFFTKFIKNLATEPALVESFVYVTFPNGEVRNIDIPKTHKLLAGQSLTMQNWALDVKPWFPAGEYRAVFTAIDTLNGAEFYNTVKYFTKQ
ncbi:hypothetical protein PSECIP111951_02808 [Pseudoalteromonas holothuriae]|uniref:Uncharacterized protein n=1 Tax=Pseudoalteromonas holothuriae TaxID=2963714 RepID=A0A9W4VY51_9GAMM|nr:MULTISPECIES: hypothetical protein [unclassified Pseudoalteromonas]CAH9055467.1 hypothetical protein PSECIP111854_01586 [Pseudoalteromonas sp. CIP111854]CAH9062960.1 hypothetical protein PSECIP111951_02808 [Pseudoalteromonas sp. CIP111951]